MTQPDHPATPNTTPPPKSGSEKGEFSPLLGPPMRAIPRRSGPNWLSTDGEEAAQMIRSLLNYIGEDSKREGLIATPRRVIRSWEKLYGGYQANVDELMTVFEEPCDEMVVLRDIEFYSTCEHHMLPFFGKAHIGYLPNKRVLGVSKMARLLEVFSRRLQIQERIGRQVTEAIMEHLQPKGCGVVLEAQHLCMVARGVEKQNSIMVTSSMRGVFRENLSARQEFMRMIGK